jgi:hypothetical protein
MSSFLMRNILALLFLPLFLIVSLLMLLFVVLKHG